MRDVEVAASEAATTGAFGDREQRLLDWIRLTIVSSGVVLHAALAGTYWWLGQFTWVWVNVASVVVWGAATILALRGRSLLALWSCYIEGLVHVSVACVVIGLQAGYPYLLVALSASLLIAFSRREGRHFAIAAIAFVVAMVTSLVLTLYVPPFTVVAPDGLQVLLYLNAGAALVVVAVVGAFARMMDRIVAEEIVGLRHQVREAMQLGQYTLVAKLGEGGMGVVYKARHAMLRRPTAIKLLPVDKVGEQSLQRFEREVQLTAELTHPNTVAIHDYGRSPDGVFYYAMEYLDGIDLETLVSSRGPLPSARVVSILRQVCGALDEAHDRGLVHRDIKPANIILCQLGNRPDVAKVLDFGLVKDLSSDDRATAVDVVSGTPAYLAPEAIADPDAVGPATDLYALGATAYFLLSGHTLFQGKTVAEVCAHHLHTEPRPLAERATGSVPAALETLIMACLAKKPADRPASARALAGDLASLALPSEWSEDDAKQWWRDFDQERSTKEDAPLTGSTRALTVDLRERLLVADAAGPELGVTRPERPLGKQ